MNYFRFLVTIFLFSAPLAAEIKDISSLSLKEKIGQLLVCGAYSNQEDAKEAAVDVVLGTLKPAGVLPIK